MFIMSPKKQQECPKVVIVHRSNKEDDALETLTLMSVTETRENM